MSTKLLRERQTPVLVANDSDSPAQVAVRGMLQKLIETTIPLDASESYVSPVFPAQFYRYIVGMCNADVAGTLFFEFSDDAELFVGQIEKPVVPNEKIAFNIRRCGPYLRVKYINSTTAQSEFSLFVYGE